MADDIRNDTTNLNNPTNARRDAAEQNRSNQDIDNPDLRDQGRGRSVGMGSTAGTSAGNTGATVYPSSDTPTTDDANRSGLSGATASLDPDRGHDANKDPLSGAPGAHPVGVGLGAAAGGAASGAATGAVIGTVAGPIGTAVGAAIGTAVGAVAGGYAGKGIAEAVNPTAEHEYWRENYQSRPYVNQNDQYDDYSDAYEYGWTARSQYGDRDWDSAENDIRSGWEKSKGGARMGWEKAKHAVRDSWDRVTRR